jgi:excinuclease ABC subunit A
LWVAGRLIRADTALNDPAFNPSPARLTVVQDRVRISPASRARLVEACEQAYRFGKGRLALWPLPAGGEPRRHSRHRHCAQCDIEYPEPTSAQFNFNHPLGACPTCRGFGRVVEIDYRLAVPDPSRTLAGGAIRPWQSGVSAECQADLLKFCRARRIPVDVPFRDLPAEHRRWIIEGDPDYGVDDAHQWPHAWYGVKGYFRWLESKAYKMHVRVLLSRYRTYTTCPRCLGRRFQPDTLLYRVRVARDAREPGRGDADGPPQFQGEAGLTLADFYGLTLQQALAWIDRLAVQLSTNPADPVRIPLHEVRSRLTYLVEVGLGYLTLDRPTRTLSGGETERVNLTTCLGTRLVHTLFVLDEPSVGLHPRDTDRLILLLRRLRDAGNTVVVVEHEAAVIRAADQVVDLGPGHGDTGGELVFQGTVPELLRCSHSLTGEYLSGRRSVLVARGRAVRGPASAAPAEPGFRPCKPGGQSVTMHDWPRTAMPDDPLPGGGGPLAGNAGPLDCWQVPVLRLSRATRHNLRDLAVEIPLRRLVCVTGVSGSGKTTLVREILLPALERQLQPQPIASTAAPDDAPEADRPDSDLQAGDRAVLAGVENLAGVVHVDQSPIGRTPRSNPAVYTGAFEEIRTLFAQTPAARGQGLTANAFSFNSRFGQCQRCRGAGFEKIEMQFLSDVYIRCPECDGRRYRPHILEVRVACGPDPTGEAGRANASGIRPAMPTASIADLLEMTVDEALAFLDACSSSLPAQRAAARLRLLQEVGLGYMRLGQPLNTLSGGESQRLKLVSHLAALPTAIESVETGALAMNRSPSPSHLARSVRRERVPAEPVRKDGSGSASGSGPRASAPPATPSLLFLFDEPTTGLHFEDVRILLGVFQRLVDAGHSVVVIEHNLDVIRSADWIIDLGPEAGAEGGRVVVAGPPEAVVACRSSHTGQALRQFGRSERSRVRPLSGPPPSGRQPAVSPLKAAPAKPAKGRGSSA